MSRLLRLLLIVSVLWCGAHIAEPVQAHDAAAHRTLGAEPGHVDGDPDDTRQGSAEHAIHHHCPVASGHAAAATSCAVESGGAGHFAAPAAELASLTRAPPLEPPAA